MKINTLLTSAAIVLTLSAAGPSWAEQNDSTDMNAQNESREQVQDSVTTQADEQLADKRSKLLQEAIDALSGTKDAIAALEKDETDTALEALAAVTGKLETIVAREPELALAPTAVDYVVYDLLADVQTIRDIGNRVEDFVDDGEFQEARALLRNFASELVIETTNLPLVSYPDAILEATALLDDGKKDEAVTVLNTALSTLVVTKTAVPLPPLRAQAMIDKAKALLEDGDADKTDEAGLTAGDYVQAARVELQVGEALGYGTEDDFKELHDILDELDEAIDDATSTGGIFDRIDDAFSRLGDRVFGKDKG